VSGIGYHPVADSEIITAATANDVQLVLSSRPSPRWNVIIAGVPAAVITFEGLQAATKSPAEALASFQSEDWRRSVLSVMAQKSVASVLESLGAEYYANAYETSDVVQQARAGAEAALASDYTAKVVAMRDNLLDLASLAAAGYAKGFFKDASPLQVHASQVLASAGVLHPEQVALRISEALPAAIDAALVKASEYMDRDPEFVQQMREAVDDIAPRVRTAEASVAAVASAQPLAARLGQHTLTNPAPVAPAQVQASAAATDIKTRLAAKIGTLGRGTVRH
jgi:hypothetical protein